jgi:hypothetical protein
VFGVVVTWLLVSPALAEDRAKLFETKISPILQSRCVSCHNSIDRKGAFSLQKREELLDSGFVEPGQPDDSELLKVLISHNGKKPSMPKSGEPLKTAEVTAIRDWIKAGAKWPDGLTIEEPVVDSSDWWSFKPMQKPDVKAVIATAASQRSDLKSPIKNPIDAFILKALAEQKLTPSKPAEPRVLIRRLYFNLIGIPPSPAEVQTFVESQDPLAYEKLVDHLLASPRYGERWARHWLDAAHFAETHGHDQDRIRENAWPYRDYLINAFNSDKPYSQFVREQLAADVFSPQDPQAIPALGFLAAGPWDESSLRDIREDTLDRQIGRYLDRDDMLTNVMSNFISLTVHCARCHDHKFDAISQADYYALQAVFAGVERANRSYDSDPTLLQRRIALKQREQQLAKPSEATKAELLGAASQQAVEAWEANLANPITTWELLKDVAATSTDGSTLTKQVDGSFLSSGERPERDTYIFSGKTNLSDVTAVRLHVLPDDTLPHKGPGRQDNGNLHLSEIECFIGDDKGMGIPIARAVADFDQQDWGVARAIDGNPQTAWGIYPEVGKSHEAIFEFKEALKLPADASLIIRLKQLHGGGHLIGRPRITVTSASLPLSISPFPPEIAAILSLSPEKRNDEQRLALALHIYREQNARELAALPKPKLVYAAAAEFEPDGNLKPPAGPRTIHRLIRGDIRNPQEEVSPGALACVDALPARFHLADAKQESQRRAALAEWLTHRDNPLTWRSIVNRVWQHHFGRGIVSTPNDFGKLGAKPTHPELLDWLAIWFRDSGQSLQALHRLIVTSETYRQSSQASTAWINHETAARTDNAATVDVDNQFLWRMNRTRLDAECVRDALLAISGRLDLRMGGPSDRQFDLKPGRHVTPIIDYSKIDLDSPLLQRRSIYRFLFRTLPDPFMESLDCPAGDQLMPVRTNSVTVQQALAMWNDAFVLRQAEHLATRLQTAAEKPADRVSLAFRLAFSREPTPAELQRFVAYGEKHGWANLCRVLVNMNEFVFIE